MNFAEFFRGLIENGTILYGPYGFGAANNDLDTGSDGYIDSPDFMPRCFTPFNI